MHFFIFVAFIQRDPCTLGRGEVFLSFLERLFDTGAFFQIAGRPGLVRAEVGDWLGQDQIVAIEPGMVTVILENGEEIYIP